MRDARTPIDSCGKIEYSYTWWMCGEFRCCRNIPTRHGFVAIVLSSDSMVRQYLSLEFIHRGICYKRTWRRRISRNYAVTLAKRFAEEIVATAEGSE